MGKFLDLGLSRSQLSIISYILQLNLRRVTVGWSPSQLEVDCQVPSSHLSLHFVLCVWSLCPLSFILATSVLSCFVPPCPVQVSQPCDCLSPPSCVAPRCQIPCELLCFTTILLFDLLSTWYDAKLNYIFTFTGCFSALKYFLKSLLFCSRWSKKAPKAIFFPNNKQHRAYC